MIGIFLSLCGSAMYLVTALAAINIFIHSYGSGYSENVRNVLFMHC